MKRKYIVFMLIGILLIAFSGTALAASNTGSPVPVASDSESSTPLNPAPGQPSDEAYQQMYEACHGPNGYMTKYYEQNGGAPQNYGGMMNGANYKNMMGF